jgi:hypothetical protein
MFPELPGPWDVEWEGFRRFEEEKQKAKPKKWDGLLPS